MHLAEKPRTDDRLQPGFDTRRLAAILADFPDTKALLLVGHEPDFSTIIGELTGARVVMKKGGLALVELDDPQSLQGVLYWLAPPKLLAR